MKAPTNIKETKPILRTECGFMVSFLLGAFV